jgi:polysaccharide deacetylase family sporulation protein PdaB
MKLYVFNYHRLTAYLLMLLSVIAVTALLSVPKSGIRGVFAVQRQVPVYSVDTEEKVAAVTFDCAWGAEDIPRILDTLREADVKATFFMVGQWAEKNPEMVKMMAQEGHDTANHSYSHFRMGALDSGKICTEIKECGDVIEKLTDSKCDLFRAPYGDYSNRLLSEAKQLGYYTIQWDVDSLDWKPDISKAEILQRVRSKTRPGSIILFHNDTPHTAELLPEIIAELKSGGYKLVPVSELIMREDYYIDHEGRQKKST